MKMKSSDIIDIIIKSKLEIADRIIGLLPDTVQPKIRELQTDVLAAISDSIDRRLKNETRQPEKDDKLHKIELE